MVNCPKCKGWKKLYWRAGRRAGEAGRCSFCAGLADSNLSLKGQYLLNQRRGHERDLLQPYKPDGSVNEAFRKAYGSRVYKSDEAKLARRGFKSVRDYINAYRKS